ncbi:uncharacterized protein B0T15DRAFT_577029 [Chaetomium strumarium]|uniref:Ig-like domain-containing protein n=1 Tax=Chaetomium strumarium TaxID=1170767 RepID=A0AAJ0LZS6_9PEZI|nr:hypothetical protein B0T15DRAFT_577029 [Chaetomium strumarium]
MRDRLVSFALVTATAVLLPGAYAARPCAGSSGGSFQYPLGELRYDSPDPTKADGLSTIAASLGRTPLHECVAQWPESWAGWYEGGSKLIWADCIFTGAAFTQDETVSFAVDWKNKTMYLAHTFACSDQQGSEGLATGSINLDLNCTTAEDSSFCVLKGTAGGARPALSITTKLASTASNTTATCAETAKKYQSWKLEHWLRKIEMEPGSSPTSPKVVSDTGPSFSLRNLADGGQLSCTPSGQSNGTIAGACQASSGTGTSANFTFDTKLNMLEISQQWKCDSSSSFDAAGVFYMQAVCDRGRNSDQFTCTSLPVWVGTGVV